MFKVKNVIEDKKVEVVLKPVVVAIPVKEAKNP